MPTKNKQQQQQLTVTEVYNNEYIDVFKSVNTFHEKYPTDGDKNEHYISTKEQTKLEKLLYGAKYDKKQNVYTKVVKYAKNVYIDPKTKEEVPYGRLYPNTTSIQDVWKYMRTVLSNGRVIGFDLSNSQPNILNQLCNEYIPNVKFNHLSAYVRHRDDIKKDIATHYKCKGDIAKNLIIRLCFGGTINEWKKYWDIKVNEDMTFVKKFEQDMEDIRKNHAIHCFPMYEESVKVFNIRKKSGQIKEGKCPYRSMIATYLQNIEGNMLLHWANDVLPQLGVEVATPIHDEINVIATEYVLNNKEFIMCKLQKSTKEKLGFDVILKEENYTLTDSHLKQIEDHRQFVIESNKYKDIKAKFEEKGFKINDTSEFGYENFEKKLIVMSKANFSIRWEEIKYKAWEKVGERWMEVDKQFIKTWFADLKKRVYDKYDFVPRPLTCSENVYNMWQGFDIEKLDVEPKSCSEILELIFVLCNKDDDAYTYFMDWLAHMFQFPAIKTGTAIVLKSKQGAGKGTLIEILRKMMGDLIGETSNPQEDIFGRHGNIHIGKILTSLDEVKNGDTCKVLGRLKNIITSNKCIYNEKGQKQVEVNNMSRFIFTTNEAIPLSIDGKEDRRYCMIECANDYCKKTEFWTAFYKNNVNDEGVIKGFFNHLMNMDISNRDWLKFPQTEFRNDIIKVSIHPIIFWFDKYIHHMTKEEEKVGIGELNNSYKKYCSENNLSIIGNCNGFGMVFKNKIEFEECGIIKVKSSGIMKLLINREKSFQWLKDNEFTVYQSLYHFENDESDDDEL